MAKKKLIAIIASAVTFVAAVIGAYAYQVYIHNKGNTNSNSSISKMESDENDGRNNNVGVSLEYSGYITILPEQKQINLYFANPSRSTKTIDIKLVATIDGEDIVLAQSDKIAPGYKIDAIKYELDREIPKGDYKGKIIVRFYNEQGIEDIVNSEISINVFAE